MTLALLFKRLIEFFARLYFNYEYYLDSLTWSISMIVAMSTVIAALFHLLQNFAPKYFQITDT